MKMNKYQEALNKIRNIVLDESGDGYYTQRYLQDFYSNACGTLQELVDKVDSFEWIPFTFDEEGVLNCELPDVDEEILVSDGDSVWQDTWCEADEGYELVPRFVHINGSVLAYTNYKKCITIEFYLEKKAFCKIRKAFTNCSMNTSMSELQAINKQCKELGWIQ